MHLKFTIRLGLLVSQLILGQIAAAQSVASRADEYQFGSGSTGQIKTEELTDTSAIVLDSLEMSLLRASQTYQQVNRLLESFRSESRQLNLLPSVLPVDLPIRAFQISSPFGLRRHPVNGRMRFHGGVDVKATLGMIVKSTAPGVVYQVGYDPTLGVYVHLKHAFGFETIYGHLKGYCVKRGQLVDRNQEVGKVGNTGLVTGPHLHYVIKKNGSMVDPFNFCFLLRRRLGLYEEKSKTSGVPASEPANCLSSKGE